MRPLPFSAAATRSHYCVSVNFINTLDPNTPAVAGSAAELAVAWPQWKTGGGSLLTFSDPDTVNVTEEDFRVEAMAYLNEVLLEEATEC